MADNVSLARSLYEAFNDRDLDVIAQAMARDGQITIVGSGDTFDGPDGARRYNQMWTTAFPDGVIEIDRIVATDDYAVVEFTGRGTHTGTLTTPAGSFPATGRSVTLQLCDVLQITDGKVTSQRTYFDSGALMTQLGVTLGQAATTQQ
jgi:steroid delta-isomerase-like uncharacterized protein